MKTAVDLIHELLYTYAERIDTGDIEGFGELFSRGSLTIDGAAGSSGARDVAAGMRAGMRFYDDGTPRTKHVITNPIVDVDEPGTSARSRCYFTVLQGLEDFPLTPIISGRYIDQLARDESGWYFVERIIKMDLFGDLSHHVSSPAVLEQQPAPGSPHST